MIPTNDMSAADRQVVLVTGAARGIGASIAETFCATGAMVVIGDVAAQQRDLKQTEENVWIRHLDVRSGESCSSIVADIRREIGSLTVLVNNAGINAFGPTPSLAESEWTKVVDTNLNGTLRMCQAAYSMLAESQGSIVNLGSTCGQIAVVGSTAYCVTKAAIHHLTKILALEWASIGIRVNAVAPTIVPTEMNRTARDNTAYVEDKIASIPIGRMATVDDVASSVVWLALHAPGMITGQVLFVDGGATTR